MIDMKKEIEDRGYSSRSVFDIDIKEINAYLLKMKKHVLEMGVDIGSARGRKGLQPNFQYAIHYSLKGLTPKEAAAQYVKEYKLRSKT